MLHRRDIVRARLAQPLAHGVGLKNILVMTGGRERTAEEFAALYRASGFELGRIVPAGPISVTEGRPV
jgi:hypothetical protein